MNTRVKTGCVRKVTLSQLCTVCLNYILFLDHQYLNLTGLSVRGVESDIECVALSSVLCLVAGRGILHYT